jgi:DNA mismatch repair protein MutL
VAMPLPGAFGSMIPSRWLPDAARVPSGGGANREYAATQADGGYHPRVPMAGGGMTPGSSAMETSSEASSPIRPMIPLGQFRDTFIIAVDEEGIAIVDQHVAHERVLFERILERLTSGTLESQRLLEPMVFEMPAGSREALRAHAADLDRLGFDVEEFGGSAVRVAAYPAILRRDECEAALRALAGDLDGLERGAAVGEALGRIAATMACHAAVKANDPLTHDKMVHILDELRRTAYSTICPHGRPVMLRLTRREVEKNFQRI